MEVLQVDVAAVEDQEVSQHQEVQEAAEEVDQEVEILREQEAETKEPNISKSLKNQVISRLVRDNSNLTVNKATSLVNKVCNKVTVKVTNPDLLYNACLQNMGAGDMMATKIIGNNSGVAIMTKSASEKADDAKVKNNFTSRTARGAVFRQEDAL